MWHTIKELLIRPWLIFRISIIIFITFLVRYKYGLDASVHMLTQKTLLDGNIQTKRIENMIESTMHMWMFPKFKKRVLEMLKEAKEMNNG